MAKMYHKLALRGGEGGREWDDDVYEGIKKVYVGQDLKRITYIRFDYVKEDGQVVTCEHGTIDPCPKEFELQYPDEHIVAVEGSYNAVAWGATSVITSLFFKTSKGRKSPTFGSNLSGLVNGRKIVIENEGKKIVGFHGRSKIGIDAIGVYFALDSPTTKFPLYKLEAQGGFKGNVWDDGFYDGIKTVRIGLDKTHITYLEFEYVKGKESETLNHGVKGETLSEFVIGYPDDYIKSVDVTYDSPLFRSPMITSLTFHTSKGRTSSFGYIKVGKKFVLEQKDRRLVGFHGKKGDTIEALGAYFAPISIPITHVIPAKKLPTIGGHEGVTWSEKSTTE